MAAASTAPPPAPFVFGSIVPDSLNDLHEERDPSAPKPDEVFKFGQAEPQQVFVFGSSAQQPEAPSLGSKARKAQINGRASRPVNRRFVAAPNGNAGKAPAQEAVPASQQPEPSSIFNFGLQTPYPAAAPPSNAQVAGPAPVPDVFQRGGSTSSTGGLFAQTKDPGYKPAGVNSAESKGADSTFLFGLNAAAPSEASASSPHVSSHFLEAALKRAQSHVLEGRASDAVQACSEALEGPSELIELLRTSVKSWQQEERKRILENENERGRLMTQLMDARDRAEKLREVKDQKELEINRERRLRMEAESKIASLQNRLRSQAEVVQENNRLRQQLSRAESKARGPPVPGKGDVIRELAKLECEPLKVCSGDARAALKKKLLLKWHPDKQPSGDHASLATAVMQELQNRSEWSW